jgi:hypothetical protein
MQTPIHITGHVVVVLEGPLGRRVFETDNLVTSAGDVHYAQRAAAGTTTNVFDALVLGTGSATPAKADTYAALTPVSGSLKRFDAGYPKANDLDAGNTGKGTTVTTYRVTYGASEANASNISRLAITNFQNGSPGSSEPLLCHAAFGSAFTKTGTDTLTVYWNHTFLGA